MSGKLPPLSGSCSPDFNTIQQAFKKNFTEGWELGGAAFTVFYQGEKVVDLWGGWAEKKYKRPWKEDTLTTIFSCTKAVSAICFAILVDRGFCNYTDQIIKFWPKFGQNGKEKITLGMLMAHKAGLTSLDIVYELTDFENYEKLARIVEKQAPSYSPGSRTAYQALSYGLILDLVFRRIDPKNRGIGQFFREEIAEKYDIDLHLGDCPQVEHRVARLSSLKKLLPIKEFSRDPKIATIGSYFQNPNGYFMKELKSWTNFITTGVITDSKVTFTMYNNPELRRAPQPAVNGLATARSLARLFQLVFDGTLISKELFEKLSLPAYANEFDHTIGEILSKGCGFSYTTSPKGDWQIGQSGAGGQNVKIDPKEGLVFAYVTNAMKAGGGEHTFTFNRLQKAVYRCVDNLKLT